MTIPLRLVLRAVRAVRGDAAPVDGPSAVAPRLAAVSPHVAADAPIATVGSSRLPTVGRA
jgi:hypothetical protein